MRLRNRLRETRTRYGIRLMRVHVDTGISYGSLVRLELKHDAPTLVTAATLAAYYNSTVEELWPALRHEVKLFRRFKFEAAGGLIPEQDFADPEGPELPDPPRRVHDE